MNAYFVSLNIKSRYRRPDVGPFVFMDAHERHVWKQTIATDTDTLARLVNEALAFLRAWDQLDMHLEIVAVEAGESAPPVENELLVPEISLPKKKRKLLPEPTLPE